MTIPAPAQAPTAANGAESSVDPDAAFDEDFGDRVDVTLIRWMLSLRPGQRLDVLQSFLGGVAELTGAQASS